jgi:DNA-binding response OmpR family regulator
MDRTFNVLLVEDDLNLGEVTVESLASLGHVVTWVKTVAAAFGVLSISHPFEVVLLDLRLGDENGETIFEKMQLLEITYPPVIILSAEPEQVMRAAALNIKTLHMLSKPASVSQIDRAIRRTAVNA